MRSIEVEVMGLMILKGMVVCSNRTVLERKTEPGPNFETQEGSKDSNTK